MDVARSIDDRNRKEQCKCGREAGRIFDYQGTISSPSFEAHYSYTFGKPVTSRTQLAEEKAKYRGETGSRLVEVDKPTDIKKQNKSNIDWDQVGKRIYKAQREAKNGIR